MYPTILLADGDELVRRVLTKALELEGYQVLVVASTAEALAVDAPIDLALVDAFLDQRSRSELPGELRRRYPELPIVVMSGLPEAGPYPFATAVLAKPFSLDALRATLLLALISR